MDFDYSILAKYLTGQISAEELSVIQVWAKSSGQNKRIWKAVQMLRIKENFDRFSSPDQVESQENDSFIPSYLAICSIVSASDFRYISLSFVEWTDRRIFDICC